MYRKSIQSLLDLSSTTRLSCLIVSAKNIRTNSTVHRMTLLQVRLILRLKRIYSAERSSIKKPRKLNMKFHRIFHPAYRHMYWNLITTMTYCLFSKQISSRVRIMPSYLRSLNSKHKYLYPNMLKKK